MTKESSTCCCSNTSSDCCNPNDEDCCSSANYSCEDEPYQGRTEKVVVDFLYLDLSCCDRCQGADKRVELAVERCRDVLTACGYEVTLNLIHVNTAELARTHRFESSPTVRVNGVDICPSVVENDCACCSDMSDASVTCRVFPFNGKYYEVPPTDMLVRGIMQVVLQNRRPDDPLAPYALPQNLKRFFEGVQGKQTQ